MRCPSRSTILYSIKRDINLITYNNGVNPLCKSVHKLLNEVIIYKKKTILCSNFTKSTYEYFIIMKN